MTRSMTAVSALLALVALRAAVPQPGEGTIAGRTVILGPPPQVPPPAAVKPADTPVCGAHVADESVQVGADGALRNAIVYLEQAPAGAAAPRGERVRLTNRSCRFEPRVQTATVGGTLVVGNDDNILHNTHGYLEGGATFFNVGLPFRGVEVSRPLARAGMVQFKCDAGHTWMSGYLLVLPHRFHATTDPSGRFRIPAVPAGNHTLKAWHEKLGSRSATVSVTAGQDAAVTIEFGR
jgi:hypothetical protein